ncbi:WD40 repeat domain-containing protein [bacterium]|nr:MAG: WD40 repeat domain-containing protein [bacterium]
MKPTKRRWTWAEKALFMTPLFMLVGAGALWWRKQHTPQQILLPSQQIEQLQFSPDSRYLAVFTAVNQTGARQGAIYETDNGWKKADLLYPQGSATSIRLSTPSWSPDGSRIAMGYDHSLKIDSRIAVWDTSNGRLKSDWSYGLPEEGSRAEIFYSHDGDQLFCVGSPPGVVELGPGKSARRYRSFYTSATALAFNPRQTMFALQRDSPHLFQVRETISGKLLWEPAIGTREAYGPMSWSKRNDFGMQCGSGPAARLVLWDGENQRSLTAPPQRGIGHFALDDRAPQVAFSMLESSPQASIMATWDYGTKKILWSRKFGRNSALYLQWSPDGERLAVREISASGVRIFLLDKRGEVHYQRNDSGNTGMQWSPDSKTLAVAGNGRVELVRVPSSPSP